ncbi:ATP-binding protein [Pusillimonas sp. SM2304]|uniref:ATP-binding protein n=1 Tax=Pusillimonas sp. SM2304 TaxID=3073241 RepID=UPI002876F0AF|nr:ATP-binding protein [Pusillimonas sp. SM2304]MDS1142213.1 ATP-binding protein [Pusillimonas sp. SM2304]
MLGDETHHAADTVQRAPKSPLVLLHLLAGTLIICILAITFLYLQWVFSGVVSSHRRQMNAAAYEAQLYFDQREGLLRSLAASVVHDHKEASAPIPSIPNSWLDQLSIVPLGKELDYDWGLVLTSRNHAELRRVGALPVFSSIQAGTTRPIQSDIPGVDKDPPISPATEEWIAGALQTFGLLTAPGGQAPIVWLRPPTDEQKRLFLYTPLDILHERSAWFGLAISSDFQDDPAQWSEGTGRVLYGPGNQAALLYPAMPLTCQRLLGGITQDSFSLQGDSWSTKSLVLSKSVGQAGWRLAYYAQLSRLLKEAATPLQMASLVAVLLCASVVFGVRHIKRTLIKPALDKFRALADSLALNKMIIDVAPVGICLLRRDDGVILLSNGRAQSWLKDDGLLREAILRHEDPDTHAGREFTHRDGRSAFLTFSACLYEGKDSILCSISDVSKLKEIEQSLVHAKRAAEAANAAKTIFLANVSHEIRTPLYGILGTLDLLAKSKLQSGQAQHLATIQASSSSLIRTINETLDLSRIEAGHTQLTVEEFSPPELIDQVIGNFAARAQDKGIRLYSVIDPAMPEHLVGDGARLQQILNNLVSNAVKFTQVGQIIVRASAKRLSRQAIEVAFQVSDTGPGIAAPHHPHLFKPYYSIDTRAHSIVPGTGLGLAICHQLVELMGGHLSFTSQPGLGTSFRVRVTLSLASAAADCTTELAHQQVLVRGAVPEVVHNLCAWLTRSGAAARPWHSHMLGKGKAPVLIEAWPQALPPIEWTGPTIAVRLPSSEPSDAPVSTSPNPFNIIRSVKAILRESSDAGHAETPAQKKPLRLKILVVEDNQINQAILREQMEYLGCIVTVAQNGHHALDRDDIHAFDAVFTDLHMPSINGDQLAKLLRSRGYKGPIIGVTADVYYDAAEPLAAARLTRVLTKPLPFSLLEQTLHDIASAAIERNA